MKLKMYSDFLTKVIKKQPEFTATGPRPPELTYNIIDYDLSADIICIDVYSLNTQDECRILDQMFQRIAKEKNRGYPSLFSYHKCYKRGG